MTNNDLAAHLPMVERIARSLSRRLPPEVQLEEMVAAGSLGLVEAASRFEEGRGVGFDAYACLRVRGAMLDVLRSGCSSTRGARRRARRVEKCRAELDARLGRAPEREEIEEALGSDAGHLDEAPISRLVSLDEPSERAGDLGPMSERLADDCAGAVDILAGKEDRQAMVEALDRLSERHRIVLSLYFFEELNLKEIGEILGVTESRVCQVRQEALRKLRSSMIELD